MTWNLIGNLVPAGTPTELFGRDVTGHFVDNSAVISTLREANDGTHYRVHSAVYRESDDTVRLTFRYITTNRRIGGLSDRLRAGQVCAWTNNIDDMDASPTDTSPNGRGRSTAKGAIVGINQSERAIRVSRNNANEAFPGVGDIIYFAFGGLK